MYFLMYSHFNVFTILLRNCTAYLQHWNWHYMHSLVILAISLEHTWKWPAIRLQAHLCTSYGIFNNMALKKKNQKKNPHTHKKTTTLYCGPSKESVITLELHYTKWSSSVCQVMARRYSRLIDFVDSPHPLFNLPVYTPWTVGAAAI